LLDNYDWRTVVLSIGVIIWLLCIPLSLVLRKRPEDHGLLPDGKSNFIAQQPNYPNNKNQSVLILEGFTLKKALKQRNFWLLIIPLIFFNASITSVIIFLIPYLTDPPSEYGLGLTGGFAGAAVTIMGLSSLTGSFGFGWLLDYYNPKHLIVFLFILQTIGLVILAVTTNIWWLIAFFLVYAPSYGGIIAIRPYILASYFGRRSFGTIQGISTGLSVIGGGISPVIIGYLKDSTGSYTWSFISLALVILISIPFLLLIRSPDYKENNLDIAI
jgi:MFS family permease